MREYTLLFLGHRTKTLEAVFDSTDGAWNLWRAHVLGEGLLVHRDAGQAQCPEEQLAVRGSFELVSKVQVVNNVRTHDPRPCLSEA